MPKRIDVDTVRLGAIETLKEAAQNGDTQAAAALVQALERVPRDAVKRRPVPKDPVKRLQQLLADTDAALVAARAAGSWQAVAALTRRFLEIQEKLDTASAAAAPTALPPTVSLADALAEARSLPLAERRALLREIAEGLALGEGPALRVVGGDS